MFKIIHDAHQELLVSQQAKDLRSRIRAGNAFLAKITQAALLIQENPACVNHLDDFKRTPLHHCARLGLLEIARLLLDAKASVDALDEMNMTAFHYAMISKHYGVAELLVNCEADVDHIEGSTKQTRLYLAIWAMNKKDISVEEKREAAAIFHRLLRWGARCNLPGENAPLFMVFKNPNAKALINELLEYGAGIRVDIDDLRLYFHSADERKQFQMMLKEASANKLIIFSKHTRFELDSSAITTLDALKQAAERGVKLKFKRLIATVEKMLSKDKFSEQERLQYQELLQVLNSCQLKQEARLAKRVPSLFKLSVHEIAKGLIDKKITAEQLVHIPDELKIAIEKEKMQKLHSKKSG